MRETAEKILEQHEEVEGAAIAIFDEIDDAIDQVSGAASSNFELVIEARLEEMLEGVVEGNITFDDGAVQTIEDGEKNSTSRADSDQSTDSSNGDNFDSARRVREVIFSQDGKPLFSTVFEDDGKDYEVIIEDSDEDGKFYGFVVSGHIANGYYSVGPAEYEDTISHIYDILLNVGIEQKKIANFMEMRLPGYMEV